MGAEAVLERARTLGVRLSVEGEYLLYQPKSVAPPDFVEALRQHKPAILVLLQAGTETGVTTRAEPVPPDGAARGEQRRRDVALYMLLERLRAGQKWLAETDAKLRGQKHVWDTMRQRSADGLDQWFAMENMARQLYGYAGCIHEAGSCPLDAVVRCQVCAGGVQA